MNQTIVWTPELDERVHQMRERGYSWPRIGELLGTSGDACRRRNGRRNTLKRPLTAWTKKDDQVYAQLYNQIPQLSLLKIAKMMGKTKHSCLKARERLGLTPRSQICILGKPNQSHRRKKKLRCDGKPFGAKIAEANASAMEEKMEQACIVGFDNGGLKFQDTTSRTCRFIKGDPKHEHAFCEKQALPGESWCEFHRGIVFQ